MNDNINSRIENTLQSFDGMEQASPKPFLLTRINAALLNTTTDTVWSKIAYYFKKPGIATFVILLLIILNIFVIKSSHTNPENENIALKSGAQKYDFAINVSVLYDIENQEP